MKETIIRLREFLLAHISNKKLQSLIIGLLSYEMVYYIFFGAGTFIIDIGIFSLITSYGCTALISNIISTICAIVFAYTTNKLWVFKSKTHGFTEVFAEFMRFAYVRFATLIMTEIILLINEKLSALCPERVDALKRTALRPLLVEIPDRHHTHRAPDSITRYIREAIGIKV